ncbi:hypothetical protein [Thermovibrio ammonificans]
MIDLEDFTPLVECIQASKEEEEDKEAFYQKQLLALREQFQKELERVRREAYRKGFEEGVKKASAELEKRFSKELNQVKRSYEERLSSLSVNIDSLVEKLNGSLSQVQNNFLEAVSEALVELLSFLYIDPSNAPFVKEKLQELLEEFKDEPLLTVEVGKGLAEHVTGEFVKVNPELGDNDFRVKFKEFTVESSLREKINLVRDELKREAKKAAQV